jgi:site-specific DNA-methyltransferase (adenine-specific)
MKPYYSEPGIALYLGDNREALATLGVRPADVALLWGDPPYGMEAVGRRNGARSGQVIRKWAPIAGDSGPFDPSPWLQFPRAVFWGANYYASRLPDSETWWTWDKKCQPWECDQADGEMAWTNLGGPPRIFRKQWLGGHPGEGFVHPTQKPEALASWGFGRAGLKPGDLVLSPWLGSGPEAAAAKRMGLRFIGIELVPEYLDACVDRLRQGVLFAT